MDQSVEEAAEAHREVEQGTTGMSLEEALLFDVLDDGVVSQATARWRSGHVTAKDAIEGVAANG